MKGYWIAHVSVTDRNAYQDYLDLAPAALAKYGAKILSRGEQLIALEGFEDTPPHRAVIFEFETYQKAIDCYHSPEYQTAREKRRSCARAHILIIQGQG